MALCRWGDDSDLYIYEGPIGYDIHVARSRCIKPLPPCAGFTGDINDYYADIGLPVDGMTFLEPTLDGLRSRVKELQAMGYRIEEGLLQEIDTLRIMQKNHNG